MKRNYNQCFIIYCLVFVFNMKYVHNSLGIQIYGKKQWKNQLYIKTILKHHLLDVSIHIHLELPVDLIHIVSFELQCRAGNHNIPSCKIKSREYFNN